MVHILLDHVIAIKNIAFMHTKLQVIHMAFVSVSHSVVSSSLKCHSLSKENIFQI